MDIFTKWASIMPLVFILLVTAVKDAFEDYKRHRTDNETNALPVRVLRNGRFRTTKSEEIHVGDYLFVRGFTPFLFRAHVSMFLAETKFQRIWFFLLPHLQMVFVMLIR